MITTGLEKPVRPSFTIGVTGNLDLVFPDGFSEADLKIRLETIFLLLRYGWTGPDPRKKELSLLGDGVFSKLVASPEINLLFAQGKQALDENSEWLILRRARPIEPVLAG